MAIESEVLPAEVFREEDQQFRLAGEDAPLWPAVAFALLGVLLAAAASSQMFAPREVVPSTPVAASVEMPERPVLAAEVKEPAAAPQAQAAIKEAESKDIALAAPAETVKPTPEPPALPKNSREGALGPEAAPDSVQAVAPSVPAVAAAAAPASAPSPEPSVCLPIVSIPFERNSSRLKASGLDAIVAPLREWLLAHKSAVLSVEGHADSTGADSYNLLLSFARAQAVAAWLANFGAPEAQLAARAAGTRAPTHTTRATTNRQVILQIEGVEACRDDGAPAQNP
jgi:outer membrane protein OmpA-like peptidoglycan-associated protein